MKTLAALLLIALPALAAPFPLRSEVAVSGPEYESVRDIGRSDAHIATDGNGYLAVWTDMREGGQPSVYAARLRADGTVVDRLGIRIANGGEAGPVVWTGSKYLIAYELWPAYTAYVRTMTLDGVFGEPIEVGRYVRFGSMATNGTNVLLVLGEEAVLLDLEGNKLKTVPMASTFDYGNPRVAAAGSTYLIAGASPDVSVQTVSSDGVPGPVRTLASREGYGEVGLASDGEQFLVVWPNGQLQAQLVARDGTAAGPVQALAGTGTGGYPTVVWRGGEYLVVYSDTGDYMAYGMRLAADGTLVAQPQRLALGRQQNVAIAVIGRGGIALFEGMKAGVFDDGSVAGGALLRRLVDVAITARPQFDVRLARLGDGYVAAWTENEQIFVSRAAGTAPVAIDMGYGQLVDVLVDRTNVIWILWADTGWVAVTRFRPSLDPIDREPIFFHTTGDVYPGAAAAGGGVIALAYDVEDDFNPESRDVAGLLLWETGTGIARKDVLLTTEEFEDYNPTVAFDGSAFVYAWSHAKGKFSDHSSTPPPVIELVGARVTPAGDLLDLAPVQIADDVGSVWEIDSAGGANGVAVAWQSWQKGTRVALFGGPVVDLGGPEVDRHFGELAPHEGGFLLVRGLARTTPDLTEVEYLVLDPSLAIQDAGTLPPYEADTYRKTFDIDVIGGPSPVFAYAKSANEGQYGHVSRVFVRRTGEAPPRRRAVR